MWVTAFLLTAVASLSSFFGFNRPHPLHYVHLGNFSNFSVRLSGGFQLYNGRLEASFDDVTWGGVCYEQFNWLDAVAACDSLGFPDSRARFDVVRRRGDTAVLANVSCTPDDEFLQECDYLTAFPWNMSCPFDLQVFLSCDPRIGPATTTFAPGPTTAAPSSNNTIAINVCSDAFCRSGCNETAVVPQSTCYPTANGHSQRSRCVNKPGQKCARMTFFNGTCSNATALFAQPQPCGVCRPDPYGQFGKLSDCFSGSSFVTYMYGCDPQCSSCSTFKRFNQGACTPLAGVFMTLDKVESCEDQIVFRNYGDAACTNASSGVEMVTADRCLGQVGYGVKYVCNGFGKAALSSAPHGSVPHAIVGASMGVRN